MTVHHDQLICLQCKYREIARHNKWCPNCPGITMAYENAINELLAAIKSIVVAKPVVEEQLNLWGALA